MNVDFTFDELTYIVREIGFQSWQHGIAETIEKKCRAALPMAKEQEDIANKAARIVALKAELALLEANERQAK